jgi:hypothetical protein
MCIVGAVSFEVGIPIGASALPPNGAGNYTQILCADPSTQDGLGISGMPEGLSNPASTMLWQVTTARVDCGSGSITRTKGIPMLVGQGNTYSQGTWSALLYQAPSNATINGGTIYRAEKAEGENAGYMGIIQQGGEYNSLYSLPRNCCDQGDWYSGNIAARGTFITPFSSENIVNLTISPDARHWDVNATCDPNGNNKETCTLTEDQWEYRIFGGEISLHASQDPQASNISGTLATENPLRGTDSITFSATDEGPGLAYIKVLVDGAMILSRIIDSNGGRCIPVAGHDAYTWAYQIPCSTSLGGRTYSLDTTSLSNGVHHVQVIIEDAAGNQAEVVDRTVAIENPGGGSLGGLPGPGQGPLSSGIGSSAAAANIPNGTNASASAVLNLGLKPRLSRVFAKRALRLPGRLMNSSGQPISGATLDVIQRVVGTKGARLVAHARTGANGSFIAAVPSGPSRIIIVAYRAFNGAPNYAAEARLQESVDAGVRLKISPRNTSSQGKIVISGTVSGPVPRQGAIVDLLVYYRHHWQPLTNSPRTNRRGHFRAAYRFQGGIGRFPILAQVPGGQAGFPFATGISRIVSVHTR